MKRKKVNILKVTGLITQIMSIYVMLVTNNKLVYTFALVNIIIQYLYITSYKKGKK